MMEQEHMRDAQELLMDFLDADRIRDRIRILDLMRPVLTDSLIDTMAVACGVEVPPADLDTRYLDLKDCLNMISRYELERR